MIQISCTSRIVFRVQLDIVKGYISLTTSSCFSLLLVVTFVEIVHYYSDENV